MGAPSKVGDTASCSSCGRAGTVVATCEEDHDAKLERSVALALERSVYPPGGITCRPCETTRFKAALPERGVCGHCGKINPKAMHNDLGATRSFCDERCISAFLADEERRVTERREQVAVVGRALAVALFGDMLDPKNRGPALTWEKLPDIAAEKARNEVFLYFPWEVTDAEKDAAAGAAMEHTLALQAKRPEGWVQP